MRTIQWLIHICMLLQLVGCADAKSDNEKKSNVIAPDESSKIKFEQDNVAIAVPKGAVNDPFSIQLAKPTYALPSLSVLDETDSAGFYTIEFGAQCIGSELYELTPHEQVFKKTIEISVPYDNVIFEAVEDIAVMGTQDLATPWTQMKVISVNLEAQEVRFSSLHLGYFVIVHTRCLNGYSNRQDSDSPDAETGQDSASDTGTATTDTDSDMADSATTDTDRDTDSVCGDSAVDFTAVMPTVLLLIDQSSSMDEGFPTDNSPSRWDALKNVLINVSGGTGLLRQYEGLMRLGLSLYTGSNGGSAPGECPILTDVAPAINNYQAIHDSFSAALVGTDTPTAEAVQAATDTLLAIDEPGPKAIILVTDGAPDSCTTPSPDGQPAHDAAVIDAVKNAYISEVSTYAIFIGNTSNELEIYMQNVANAGLGASAETDMPYWIANDISGLSRSFVSALSGVQSCVLELAGDLTTAKASTCTVALDDGNTKPDLVFDDPNGWRVNAVREIELMGTACNAMHGQNASVHIACPCDAFVAD